ncbi:MAG: glycosyltransferase family 2 protein [Solirubrobacterales bacterium]|nr:glycosyltransferase family 2 protein [Solirubrobacterales bacterium]
MDLAVIIPSLNEREALPGLIEEIDAACTKIEPPIEWEVLVVDDGSTDRTFEMVEELALTNDRVWAIRLRRNFGKSSALSVGFDATDADTVLTIDGDGQDDPADIPLLLAKLDDGFDLVSGWKRDRQDPASRRMASKAFNWFTTKATGVHMHDMNCGFKAYRGDCARSIDVYGEMHRFMPALAVQGGWTVAEVPVNHRAREFGKSRFGFERYLRGALDLVTVVFLGRYQFRPLHLFGGAGAAMTFVGLLVCLYLTIVKIGGSPIGERPLLFLGVLLIVVGVQLMTLGLLAQMQVLTRREIAGSGFERGRISQRLDRASSPSEKSQVN